MSETLRVDDESQEETQPLSAEVIARQERWHAYVVPLHDYLHAQNITFGEHSGSSYDRFIHGPLLVDHIIKQGGEEDAIKAAFPPKTRRFPNRPTRIVTSSQQIFDLLKPLRDDNLALDKAKRANILERASTQYNTNSTIGFGLRLHDALDTETGFGGVTLDAVAALTLALEKIQRQRKAS